MFEQISVFRLIISAISAPNFPQPLRVLRFRKYSHPLSFVRSPGLQRTRWGGLIANDEGATTREGVFAGGDAVTGAATVILAMGAGRKAAAAIDAYIQGKGAQ